MMTKYEELLKLYESIEQRITRNEHRYNGKIQRMGSVENKVIALAEALGYRFITIDTHEAFVFNNTVTAIKKELLEDTND